VVLSIVGIGPERATGATERALERFRVSAIVVSGIAGGLSSSVRIADVTIPERWTRHDEDNAPWFSADAKLLAAARVNRSASLRRCHDAVLCRDAPAVLIGGNGVTGARFVEAPTAAAALTARLSAVVTDMETASIAEVADKRDIPFIGVRAVSDIVATGRSGDLVEQYEDLAADNAAATTVALLERIGVATN
jgi:adenosylhomocysteine nucleosidase